MSDNMYIEATKFIPPNGRKGVSRFSINDDLKDKVDQIFDAGFWFEDEVVNETIRSTTITGHEADYAFAVSGFGELDHVQKIEKMIDKFDIQAAVAREENP